MGKKPEGNPNADATMTSNKVAAATGTTSVTNGAAPSADFEAKKQKLIKTLESCIEMLASIAGSKLDANQYNYNASIKALGKIDGAIHFIHTITGG